MKEGTDDLLGKINGTGQTAPMTDPMMGFPSIASGGYTLPGVPAEQGVGETVTAPRQKKMSFLSKLVDGVLMAGGNKPVLRQKFEHNQLVDAMEGFADDPLAAIKRVARHNPDAAYKMYNSYMDDQRADKIATRQVNNLDMRNNEYFLDRMGGMLGTATAENYPQVKAMVQRYANARGVQLPFELPETYDETAITAIRMGEVPVAKQLQMDDMREYRRSRLGQMDRTIDNTQDYRERRLDQIDTAEGGRNTRAAVAETGRNTRYAQAHPKSRVVKTPNGDMELSPSGNLGKIGDQVWKKTAPGQWKRIK
jgi:hypothetical protein